MGLYEPCEVLFAIYNQLTVTPLSYCIYACQAFRSLCSRYNDNSGRFPTQKEILHSECTIVNGFLLT